LGRRFYFVETVSKNLCKLNPKGSKNERARGMTWASLEMEYEMEESLV